MKPGPTMKPRLVLSALAAMLVSAVAMAEGAAVDQPYRVTDTVLGSMLPQDIIRSALPFDARYGDLTPAQKAVVASNYESLGAGDEPPYPQYGLHHLVSPLEHYARAHAPVGAVIASVMVDSQGNAGEVSVYKSPDPAMAKLVSAALALEHYKPALCAGQPCKMAYVLRLEFPQRVGNPVTTSTLPKFEQNSGAFVTHY